MPHLCFIHCSDCTLLNYPQSRVLCVVVCALSLVNITFISSSIVGLLNLFLGFHVFLCFL